MKGESEMHLSVLTKKWQTTIPKEIRNHLELQPNDKLLYVIENERVVIRPVRGNILELRGSVKTDEKPADFNKIRKAAMKKVARNIVAEGE